MIRVNKPIRIRRHTAEGAKSIDAGTAMAV